MQTDLSQDIKHTEVGKEADAILRSCVHCGFCTATCPTYQQLGDELDSPRGRIYLIKQMLEGKEVTAKTQKHLDRCLTCRSCETTCPSGVKYGRLVEIGREYIDNKVERPLAERLKRKALRSIIPYPNRLAPIIKASHLLKPILPPSLKAKLPVIQKETTWPNNQHTRKMLVLEGCAQSVVKAGTNAAAAKIFDKLEISLTKVPEAKCCGAVSYHMSKHEEGLAFMRHNIDTWWPFIEQGYEGILISASGCGAMVKEYGDALKHDKHYAVKAAQISALTKDPCEIIANEDLTKLNLKSNSLKVAFQTPCTLQHAQQLNGHVETILGKLGFEIFAAADGHLCCGSAGTYSLLQPELSQQLLDNKLNQLMTNQPDVIATANIGCHMHLESKAKIPVKHWLELVTDVIS